MFHTIFEALPSQTRGREIARTDNFGDAQSIASNMSKVYTEFTYTVENGNIGRTLTYKGGQLTGDTFKGECRECYLAITRNALIPQSHWVHSHTGTVYSDAEDFPYHAAVEV